MGAKQSRTGPEGESWQSRVSVSVKPSEKLIEQLQQQQQQQQRQQQEQQQGQQQEQESPPEDHHANKTELRDREEHARRTRTRREEVDVRVQELVARKQAESANLSSILDSALIPDAAVRRTAVCDGESQAVVKCYQSKGTQCAKFVDQLELCASNASRTP